MTIVQMMYFYNFFSEFNYRVSRDPTTTHGRKTGLQGGVGSFFRRTNGSVLQKAVSCGVTSFGLFYSCIKTCLRAIKTS